MIAPLLGLGTGLGRGALRGVGSLGGLALFTGRLLRALATPPLRLRPFVDELYKLGVLSLTIIGVSGLAVGMVIALQGHHTLARYGATSSLGALVGLSLVRELGPVLTALLFAGRAGSATTAEIASMVASEQMDGLRMMAVPPIHYVAAPKNAAMVVVVPLLTGLFIAAGLFGGYLVSVRVMGGDGGLYLASLQSAVEFRTDVAGCLLKALVFGGLIGLISTYRGFISEPNSAGVSAATTSTVVVSSVSVLVFDYMITALWEMSGP